ELRPDLPPRALNLEVLKVKAKMAARGAKDSQSNFPALHLAEQDKRGVRKPLPGRPQVNSSLRRLMQGQGLPCGQLSREPVSFNRADAAEQCTHHQRRATDVSSGVPLRAPLVAPVRR